MLLELTCICRDSGSWGTIHRPHSLAKNLNFTFSRSTLQFIKSYLNLKKGYYYQIHFEVCNQHPHQNIGSVVTF